MKLFFPSLVPFFGTNLINSERKYKFLSVCTTPCVFENSNELFEKTYIASSIDLNL